MNSESKDRIHTESTSTIKRVSWKKREREREAGWVRVKGRRHEAKGHSERRFYAGEEEVTLYFFTNFPEKWRSKNPWEVFNRWGRVQEVFIPDKRNRQGKKFGFVRFYGIRDPSAFGRKLDQIVIGCTKLFVNKPRFVKPVERKWKSIRPVEINGGDGASVHHARRQPPIRQKDHQPQKSYAEALTKESRVEGEEQSQRIQKGTNGDKIVQLWVDKKVEEWLAKSWVGKTRKVETTTSIQEMLIVEGLNSIRARYMGSNLVLLYVENGADWKEITSGAEDWLNSLFESIVPWSPSITLQNRVVWLHCSGVPLHLWKRQSLEQLLKSIGELLELDKET